MGILYIDIQGFVIPQFIPKEISFTYDGEKIDTFLFKSPTAFSSLPRAEKRKVIWLEKNHHGIPFNSGNHKLYLLSVIISKFPAELVIVKGVQKRDFLLDYYSNVTDVDEVVVIAENFKFKKSFIIDCRNHRVTYAMCSKHNVIDLYRKCKLENNN